MIKRPGRFLIVILLVGWLFDFLFWDRPVGVNYTIFVVVILGAGLGLMLSNGIRPDKKSLLLLIPLLFFSAVPFLRREPLTVGLAYTFSVLLLGVFAATYLGGRWMQYTLGDYFSKLFIEIGDMFVVIPDFVKGYIKIVRKGKEERKSLPIKPIVRGLLIALPIVFCFGSLLASADAVFAERMVDFLDIFDFEDGLEKILRLMLMLLVAYLVGGVYLHAAEKSTDEKLIGEEEPVTKPFLGFTETAIVLGSVVLLFLSFVVIQFQYFFGGDNNIGLDGFTYSEYARKGFRELWIVALFSLILVIVSRMVTKFETPKQKRIYSILNVAILANVMVILVSAYERLMMAIEWHSYSRLRVYPQIFIISLGVLFLAIVVLEIYGKERAFTLAALLVSIGYAAALFTLNVDASIARVNIDRVEELGRLSVWYHASLSSDVVPVLVEEFENPDHGTKFHEAIGAILICHVNVYTDDVDEDEEETQLDWRSFNFSDWQAQQALDDIWDELDDYKFIEGNYHGDRVKTPSQHVFHCYGD